MLLHVWNLKGYPLPESIKEVYCPRGHREKYPKDNIMNLKILNSYNSILLRYECEENEKHQGWSRLKAVLTMCGRSGS